MVRVTRARPKGRVRKKKHLLDPRHKYVFNEIQTRCGKVPRSDDNEGLDRAVYIDNWDDFVEEAPTIEDSFYCKLCLKHYREYGKEEEERYAERDL